jgi:hypothetical protein
MYNLVLKEWHSELSAIKVSTEVPEVVTLESLAVALGSTVAILKGYLEGFADDGSEIAVGERLAKQWFNTGTNEGPKDVCTLADAWRLTELLT